jgi:hypothetical protein
MISEKERIGHDADTVPLSAITQAMRSLLGGGTLQKRLTHSSTSPYEGNGHAVCESRLRTRALGEAGLGLDVARKAREEE